MRTRNEPDGNRTPSRLRVAGLLACACAAAAFPQDAPPSPPSADAPLEEVVITGEFPGPGMWKVTRAGDGASHVLWIVGDPWALPKRMQWKSRDIEAKALASQEILRDAAVTMKTDEKMGFFRKLTLVPALLEARRNPGDEKLEDVLPAPLYARWLTQKKLYLGRAKGVEEWRPLFAADKLRRAAFDDLDLRERGVVWEALEDLVKKNKLKVTTPTLELTFDRDQVREKLREFSRESLDDMACFSSTLDLTEAVARRDVENARARAWATADLEALTTLPPLPNPFFPCAMAVMSSQVAREVIPADIAARVEGMWLDAATKALDANQTTLAVVSMWKLLREDGYLVKLRARGFEVEAPQ